MLPRLNSAGPPLLHAFGQTGRVEKRSGLSLWSFSHACDCAFPLECSQRVAVDAEGIDPGLSAEVWHQQ